ncbi:glycosyltransferase [Candidatus Dependentiae bacterium]|nr:glycosyltransferase [Candidatus Dependentiae bacterium]MCC7415470.1 glycosyltransferase [Campylobacterota bacterium]
MNGRASHKSVLYLRVDLGGQQLTAGGSVAHTLGVIKGFMSNNWSVICVSSALFEPLRLLSLPAFHQLRMPRLFKPLRWKINSLLSNIFFTIRIIRLCSGKHITHVYQRHAPFCLIGVLVAWWLRVPLTLEYNGSEVWMARHWQTGSYFSLQWLLRFFEDRCLRWATHIVVVSNASYQQLVQTGLCTDKLILKANGVDTDQLDPSKLVGERERIRQQYAYQERFLFGFVGTFSPWHGINQLAAMIPAIVAREPKAAFLLIGDGELHAWLCKQLLLAGISDDVVTCTGRVPQHTAHQYLAACDAFLLPTQPNPDGTPFFGSPIKLFEYMSMAKPIIASDITQVADILSSIGILVDPSDTQAFVDAACQLMHEDTQTRETRGALGRQYVVMHGTWHEHVKAIISATQQAEYASVDERAV